MLDKGQTSDYTMVYMDMMLQNFDYLGSLDWDSELGKALHELQISVSLQCPKVLVYKDLEETPSST